MEPPDSSNGGGEVGARSDEAPASLVRQFLAAADGLGFTTRQIAAECGLNLAPGSVRVRWSALASFLDRFREVYGADAFRAVCEQLCHSVAVFRMLGKLAVTPQSLDHLTISAARPAWPFVELRLHGVRGGGVAIEARLSPDRQPCEAFFLATAHAFRALPRLMGLPDADIVARVWPSGGKYLVRPPARTARRSRAEAWLAARGRSASASARTAFLLLNASLGSFVPVEAIEPDADRVAAVRAQGLTATETRVAMRLADGLRPREIASELGVSVETIRSHLKHAYGKAGVHRQSELVRFVLSANRQYHSRREA